MDADVATYALNVTEISGLLFHMCWGILEDLATRDTRGKATDELDITLGVYATGSRSTQTMVFQNRCGHLAGTSSAVAVGLCRRAFEVLKATATGIRERKAVTTELRANTTLSIREVILGMTRDTDDEIIEL